MGITKSEIFTEHQNRIASIAKVIGHPARVAILQYVIAQQSCVCGDLVEEIGLAQPTISQHLRELKSIGILKGTVEGTSVCYCIDPHVAAELKTIFDNFFEAFDCSCTCC